MKIGQANNTLIKPKLALGIGFFAMYFANQSVPILAIPFYQMTLGVDPFLLGLALTIPMIISTLFGPWVGHLSDNYQSKFGRRRPFIFIAAWVSALLFGLIWMVSPDWSEAIQLSYFTLFSILFYFAVMFLSVPMTCLSYEMTNDHHERTEVMGFTSYFIKLGSFFYQWLFPLAQLAIFGSIFIGIKYVGWGVGIFIIGLLGCLPALFSKEKVHDHNTLVMAPSLLKSLKTLRNNKPLLILLALTILQLCGGAFTASIDYYLLVYYMHDGDVAQGSIWKGILSSAYAIFGLLSIPLISKLSANYGKVNTFRFIYWLTACGGVLKWFIFTPDTGWLIVIDAIFCTAVWTTMTMLIPSMLADLCDEDELAHNKRREGLFVSIHTWIVNISMALAVLIAGLSLNIIGFDAMKHSAQTSESIMYMRFILSVGTVLFSLLPLLLLRYYRIDADKSRATRQKLDERFKQNQSKKIQQEQSI